MIKNNGIKTKIDKIKSILIIFKKKLIIICTNVCPAIILAANLIAKLNNLIK